MFAPMALKMDGMNSDPVGEKKIFIALAPFQQMQWDKIHLAKMDHIY